MKQPFFPRTQLNNLIAVNIPISYYYPISSSSQGTKSDDSWTIRTTHKNYTLLKTFQVVAI